MIMLFYKKNIIKIPSVAFGCLKNVGGSALSISSDIPDRSPFFNLLRISRSFCDLQKQMKCVLEKSNKQQMIYSKKKQFVTFKTN